MTDQKQLNQIALWPAEQDAVRMLKVVGEVKTPGQTALLSLLQWAVEDSGEEVGKAGVILDELLYKTMHSHRVAVQTLLNLDNPEQESLAWLTDAETPAQIAQAMLALANQAVEIYPY